MTAKWKKSGAEQNQLTCVVFSTRRDSMYDVVFRNLKRIETGGILRIQRGTVYFWEQNIRIHVLNTRTLTYRHQILPTPMMATPVINLINPLPAREPRRPSCQKKDLIVLTCMAKVSASQQMQAHRSSMVPEQDGWQPRNSM